MVFGSQIPASPILVGAEPVPGHQVAAQHVPPPAAVQADDVVSVNRTADWDGRGAFGDGLC